MGAFNRMRQQGFTIVELLIVVVVIAILAAITIVAYNGISSRATDSSLKSDLSQSAKKLEHYKTLSGDNTFPVSYATAGVVQPQGITYSYTSAGASYCLQSTKGAVSYYMSSTSASPIAGTCPVSTIAMQTVTNASCSTTRTMALDARDQRTYWIQKLSDGKCWMLTNLAYAGGGTNTYSDVRTISDGGASAATYSAPRYYVPTGANPTTNPTTPSTSTTGTGQYGYLYNWCAAMGSQTATSSCANATTPVPSTSISICPAGWRLPAGNSGTTDYQGLNTAINGGSGSSDTGLRNTWLMQRGGEWYDGFYSQSDTGSYWTSTQNTAGYADYMYYGDGPGFGVSYYGKVSGQAVRCIAL